MTKKNNSVGTKKTKKKGSKGKQARAKAKLEKQWGEELNEREFQDSKKRHGKSRILGQLSVSNNDTLKETEPSAPPFHNNLPRKDEIDHDDQDGGAQVGDISSFLKSLTKKYRQSKSVNVDFDEDVAHMHGVDSDMDSTSLGSQDDTDFQLVMQDKLEFEIKDPFAAHFNQNEFPENEARASRLLSAAQELSRLSTPACHESLDIQLSSQLKQRLCIQPMEHPEQSQEHWSKVSGGLFHYNREILKHNWTKVNRSAFKRNADGLVTTNLIGLDSLQSVVYPAMASYADVLMTAESVANNESFNNIITLHILNHVLTSRGRIQRNNRRVQDIEDNPEMASVKDEELSLRDQGYTRASVLILLPTRGVCHSFVKSMLALLGNNATVENEDRFEAEYGPVEVEDNAEELDTVRRHRKAVLKSKGKEWNQLFGDDANSDDDFKIGISFSPKAVKETAIGNKSGVGVRFFSDFYKSDIIITSPLALKVASEGSEEDGEGDTDFLTSIEICYVGCSDVLIMQNWDHLNASLNCLNRKPTRNNDTDFSRVREYLLMGLSKFWRQLIICSKFIDPCILSTFKRHASSLAGTLKVRRRVAVSEACLLKVLASTKQVFQRITSKSFVSQGSERLEYFEKYVMPQLQRLKQKHTLIYVPSYFEYVSLRNLLLKKDIDFCSVTEYSRPTEVNRGRARFLQGRKSFMLYTGRAHFFNRHAIRGAKHIIFFGLPEHSEFYAQVVNFLLLYQNENDHDEELSSSTSCLSLFTKYEAHALERICGRQNAERMVKGEKSAFMFLT